jgi:hypothetical protein
MRWPPGCVVCVVVREGGLGAARHFAAEVLSASRHAAEAARARACWDEEARACGSARPRHRKPFSCAR